MKICFYAFGSLPVHASSLEERPLGGTETALIRVSEVLVQRGHQVIVVTSHQNPQPFNVQGGAVYIPPQLLSQYGEFDVFVAVQFWKPILGSVPAKRLFFWTGDGPEQYSNLGIGDPRVIQRLEKMFVVSAWHKTTLCQASGFPLEKCVNVSNGIHPSYFSDEVLSRIARQPKRLIYTSAPYRGLELAAKYFVSLKKLIPDLELHVFAGLSIYDRDQSYSGPHVEAFEVLKKRLQYLDGVKLYGNIRQRELAEEYCKSRVLLYPNIINETCCITALEAQAGGCVVVASENSALPESVGEGGVLISGEPGSQEYSASLLEKLYQLMSDDLLWSKYSNNGRERIFRDHTWQEVALRIERELL